MRLKNIFIAAAIASVVYGLGTLLLTSTILGLHGMIADESAVWMTRFFGVELLGVGLICWFIKDSDHSKARAGVILGLLISNVIGAIIAIWATLTGGMNAMGWLPFAIYGLLALGFAYFHFGSKD